MCYLFEIDEENIHQPKGRESRFTITREQKQSTFKNPKTTILGRQENLKILATETNKVEIGFNDLKKQMESLTPSQEPIKMMNMPDLSLIHI